MSDVVPAGPGGGTGDRRSARAVLVVAAALLLVLAGGVAVLVLDPTEDPPLPLVSPPAAVPVSAPLVALPAAQAGATTDAALADRLAPLLADPALGGPAALVVDAATGSVVVDVAAGRAAIPASTTKLVTAAAALTALDPTSTLATRVLDGGPGTVVLVGGGDPTLTQAAAVAAPDAPDDPGTATSETEPSPPGVEEPARLDELAAATAAALSGRPVEQVLVDASLFSGGTTYAGWKPSYVTSGVVGPVTALAVDGGRLDPERRQRAGDPPAAAGQAFAEALRRAGVAGALTVVPGAAPAGAAELASVASPTVEALVTRMLRESDNDVAEALGRHVALATGRPATPQEVGPALLAAVAGRGLDLSGVTLSDASGLSRDNRLTPRAAVDVLAAAARDDRLRPLLVGLPVAGYDGTLGGRYASDGPRAEPAAVDAQGEVRAKTGTLSSVNALAGTAVGADGRLLLFAVLADRVPPGGSAAAELALDRFAAALTR